MKYWIVSDTHFDHKNIIKYCNRPDDFESIIRKNLLKIVDSNDVLIHLGDVSLGRESQHNDFFGRMGFKRKILVLGNHDRKSINWFLDHGWDFACDRFDLDILGRKIAFSHVPLSDEDSFDLNIHGHCHNNGTDYVFHGSSGKKHYLISLEETNYQPVCLTTILKNYDRQKQSDRRRNQKIE